jgi:hypothetical protein
MTHRYRSYEIVTGHRHGLPVNHIGHFLHPGRIRVTNLVTALAEGVEPPCLLNPMPPTIEIAPRLTDPYGRGYYRYGVPAFAYYFDQARVGERVLVHVVLFDREHRRYRDLTNVVVPVEARKATLKQVFMLCEACLQCRSIEPGDRGYVDDRARMVSDGQRLFGEARLEHIAGTFAGKN